MRGFFHRFAKADSGREKHPSGAKALNSPGWFAARLRPCPDTKLGKVILSCLAVCLLATLAMGAADGGARFNSLTTKLMCTCGCGQTLATCNHLGCSSLASEGAELKTAINRGDSDDAILVAFENKYGATVLSAPLLTRFNMIAWVVPPAVLLLGIAGTFVLVRRWRRRVAAMPAVEHGAGFEAMRERVRKETEL